MANRALCALATAAILSASSITWAQEAPDAGDGTTGADATLGESGAGDQDAAPGDVEDGGMDDGSAIDPGIFDDAGLPGAPSVPGAPDPGGASVPQNMENEPAPAAAGPPANAGPHVSASWGDAAPAAREVQGPNAYAPVDGCAGCSTGEKGESGPLAFVLAALVAGWRGRRRPGR